MKERQSFVVYKEWRDMINTMSANQSQQFLQAMFAYQDGDDIDGIITDPSVKMVFTLIKKQFDRDAEKYEDKCQKRSEAGKKGNEKRQEALAKAKSEPSDLANAKNDLANLANADFAKNDLANLADNDNDNDNDLKETHSKECAKKSSRFSAPTVEQVRDYCREKGLTKTDPQSFVDFYASKGWMVGSSHMKDWRAAVRNWSRRDKSVPYHGKPPNRFNNFQQRQYDYDELEQQLLAADGG